MSGNAHCEKCDPANGPELIRELVWMRPEALERAIRDLLSSASDTSATEAERRHDLIRAALCKLALAEQNAKKSKKRKK